MVELLAPAGGMAQLKAAAYFGADAVYGGMKNYGLRAFAGCFDGDELTQACQYLHERNKRFYATMNILATDDDLQGLLEAAGMAREAKVDALIISDVGAAAMVHRKYPDLPIHISTQSNVTNSQTVQVLHEVCGAERIVLSRELNLEQIQKIRSFVSADVSLECFVHGAMCVAYSGRCLLSAALTGRSANRGACAQPCRWQYALMEEKSPDEYMPVFEDERGTYLYSAYDLCMLEHLPQLLQAGVESLKIEGRMKTAYYVAGVVNVYRRALDLLLQQGEAAYREALPTLMADLQKVSHRKSNTGFYFGRPTPPAGAGGYEQAMEYVADVMEGSAVGGKTLISLKNRFYKGDRLELLCPQGSLPFTAGWLQNQQSGELMETASVAGTKIMLDIPYETHAGDMLRGPNRNHKE